MINTLRVVVTVASFLLFIATVLWAYAPKNKQLFDEAAQLPFENE